MINLLVSLAIGAAVFLAVLVPFSWVAALLPGIAAFLAAYVLLARRTSKQLEAAMPEVQRALQSQRLDVAIKTLQELRPLGRWQFLVGPAIDAQIGMIYYAHKREPEAAKPYLEKAYVKNWQAKAMLGALHFKKKEYERMEEVFEGAVRHNKKAPMLWSTYAWTEWKMGRRDKAMEILGRALKHQPDDERLKSNLLALQNDKKMKMRAYEPDWWALHLEKPPMQMATPTGRGGRGGRRPTRRR